jgi:DNA-directed RNA polymerase subunit RPC12/RpoP
MSEASGFRSGSRPASGPGADRSRQRLEDQPAENPGPAELRAEDPGIEDPEAEDLEAGDLRPGEEDEQDELWCGTCERTVEDEELTEDGACPDCGTQLVEADRRNIPWKFKFMIAATVVYLGYRIYQGIGWLLHHG